MKRLKTLLLTLGVILSIGITSSVSAWGPASRPTFTLEEPADYPVFNSITNHTGFGDERNFVSIREAGVGTYKDEIDIVPGKEYEVYVLVHNNAKSRLNDIPTEGGVGIAVNVRLNAVVPLVVKKGEKGTITSTISADNTNPKEVWDEAYVTATAGTVDLSYVPGSAIIHSNGAVNGRVLSEALFSAEGTFLGYDSLNGVIPGCFQYSSYVIYRIKADAPAFTIDKTVSVDGKTFSDKVTTTPGKEVTFKIVYLNTGTTDQLNVNIKDTLPEYMTYVPGSARLTNISHPDGAAINEDNDAIITGGGINIGSYGPGAGATITFRAKIAESKDLPCGTKHLNNIAYAITGNGNKEDDANVDVVKTCELPKTGPMDLLLIGGVVVAVIVLIAYLIQWKMGKCKKAAKRPAPKKK